MPDDLSIREKIRTILRTPETGPAMRRYFVNTMFDSTFVILGVIIGSAFSPDPSIRVVIATILTSSVALGISTGVSVYEAEKMEQERRIKEIEKALLSSLKDTQVERMSEVSILLISLVNFSAPLIGCFVSLLPFLVLGSSDIRLAAWIASGFGISILFVTGGLMGRMFNQNPLIKGIRMAIIGGIAFAICFWIESLV